MENNFNNGNQVFDPSGQTKAVPKTFVSSVMMLMSLGLIVSGVLAYLFGTSEQLLSILINPESGMTTLGWIVTFAPLGMVLLMGAAYRKFSAATITLLFIVFSALMGMSLSYIFVIYSMGSIALTFFISAGLYWWYNP